ncbi:hypothetical protein BDN70DRAFT_991545 [Pholiota conissans]|uniref:AB hydrolase-1 domain-containing protein n=1 Tax=Pholiota conissans TaxID=109636 RepID=A0A9P6CWJ7_9AGAR|nr:hypothetical protein BDN70DRAFT_991545 [Pholiota conissans]
MIGNSPAEYIGIRIGIGALRVISPASIAYLACCAIWREFFYIPVAVVATAEAAFYLLVYLPRKSRLQSPPRRRPPELSLEQRQIIFQRCMAAETTLATPEFLYPRGWFLPKHALPRKDDVIDWLLWALFSSSRDEIDIADYEEELEGYVREIEKYHNQSLAEGRSHRDELHSMRITLDPVRMSHRPLIWYMIVALVDSFTSISLACLGFRHYTPIESQWRRTFPPRPILYLLSRSAPPGVLTPYWYRPHTSTSKRPIVFLHGIGIGLYPYIPFFRSITSGFDSDVGIVLPEMMSICMHMTPRSVPPREEMLASLNIILESLQDQEIKARNSLNDQSSLLGVSNTTMAGWDRVVLITHSYGTFVAGWIVRACIGSSLDSTTTTITTQSTAAKSLCAKFAHLILVDPIPILLSNPAVAYNFLYRHPSTVPLPQPGHALAIGYSETALTPTPSTEISVTEKSPWYSSAAAWQLWYFASRDADVARTLFRSFFWAEGGLWREDLIAFINGNESKGTSSANHSKAPRNLAIVLGGMDQVVPAEAVREYITREPAMKEYWVGSVDSEGEDLVPVSDTDEAGRRGHGSLEVLFNPVLDHAVIFDDPKWTRALLAVVQRYVLV